MPENELNIDIIVNNGSYTIEDNVITIVAATGYMLPPYKESTNISISNADFTYKLEYNASTNKENGIITLTNIIPDTTIEVTVNCNSEEMIIYEPSEDKIIHDVDVDLVQRNVNSIVHLVQYDDKLPIIAAHIRYKGNTYTLPDEFDVAKIKFKKSDGTYIYKYVLGTNIERNVIYFDIDLAMSLYSGTSPVTIEIEARDKRFHTSFIMLSFERNPIQKNDIPSESSFPDIYQILANKLGYADVEDIISNDSHDKIASIFAIKEFVNSSINSLAAFYITKNENRDQFATKSELINAEVYYSGGEPRIPTKNDYALVQSDEDHSGKTTRYIYNNGWEFQFVVNDEPFTQAQLAAINSGITSSKLEQLVTLNTFQVINEEKFFSNHINFGCDENGPKSGKLYSFYNTSGSPIGSYFGNGDGSTGFLYAEDWATHNNISLKFEKKSGVSGEPFYVEFPLKSGKVLLDKFELGDDIKSSSDDKLFSYFTSSSGSKILQVGHPYNPSGGIDEQLYLYLYGYGLRPTYNNNPMMIFDITNQNGSLKLAGTSKIELKKSDNVKITNDSGYNIIGYLDHSGYSKGVTVGNVNEQLFLDGSGDFPRFNTKKMPVLNTPITNNDGNLEFKGPRIKLYRADAGRITDDSGKNIIGYLEASSSSILSIGNSETSIRINGADILPNYNGKIIPILNTPITSSHGNLEFKGPRIKLYRADAGRIVDNDGKNIIGFITAEDNASLTVGNASTNLNFMGSGDYPTFNGNRIVLGGTAYKHNITLYTGSNHYRPENGGVMIHFSFINDKSYNYSSETPRKFNTTTSKSYNQRIVLDYLKEIYGLLNPIPASGTWYNDSTSENNPIFSFVLHNITSNADYGVWFLNGSYIQSSNATFHTTTFVGFDENSYKIHDVVERIE